MSAITVPSAFACIIPAVSPTNTINSSQDKLTEQREGWADELAQSHGQRSSLGQRGLPVGPLRTTVGFSPKLCFSLSHMKWIINDKRALCTGEAPGLQGSIGVRGHATSWEMTHVAPPAKRDWRSSVGTARGRAEFRLKSKPCRTAGTWTASPCKVSEPVHPFPFYKPEFQAGGMAEQFCCSSKGPKFNPQHPCQVHSHQWDSDTSGPPFWEHLHSYPQIHMHTRAHICT